MIRLLKLLEPDVRRVYRAVRSGNRHATVVVTFLAILDWRANNYSTWRRRFYAPIYVQRKGDPAFVLQADA
jgi:hypothetical protein